MSPLFVMSSVLVPWVVTPVWTRSKVALIPRGIRFRVALPDGSEEIAPAFENTAAETMGIVDGEKAHAKVLIGAFHGAASQVTQFSETLYVDVTLPAGGEIDIPADTEERAIYVIDGSISVAGDAFTGDQLLVFRPGDEIVVRSEAGASFMIFGGASIGSPRHIWWNFVSSAREKIEEAKREWRAADWGMGLFDLPTGDRAAYIPAPE